VIVPLDPPRTNDQSISSVATTDAVPVLSNNPDELAPTESVTLVSEPPFLTVPVDAPSRLLVAIRTKRFERVAETFASAWMSDSVVIWSLVNPPKA